MQRRPIDPERGRRLRLVPAAAASRVAHEVRNPLGVMAVHLDLVRRAVAGNDVAWSRGYHFAVP